jgi:pyruvate dehydrogenase E2 component (dihydrolipoamide acetyltransferase)
MRHIVKLPRVADTVDEVVVLEWHVLVADVVVAGDRLVTVETDKVTVEIPSPVGGTVVDLHVDVDDEISTGQQLCTIEAP